MSSGIVYSVTDCPSNKKHQCWKLFLLNAFTPHVLPPSWVIRNGLSGDKARDKPSESLGQGFSVGCQARAPSKHTKQNTLVPLQPHLRQHSHNPKTNTSGAPPKHTRRHQFFITASWNITGVSCLFAFGSRSALQA